MTENIKLVLVGDGAVGKTSMFLSYAHNRFPDDCVPTVFYNYNAKVLFENRHVSLGLHDISSRIERLRPLAYPETNVFLIAFSLVDPSSLENVKAAVWYPEIQEHAPGVPILLIGTKLDLREDSQILRELQERDEKAVTTSEGEEVAEEIKVQGYFECSAKTQEGLKEVFQAAIRVVLALDEEEHSDEEKKTSNKPNCSIL